MSSYNGFKGYAVNTIGTYANIIQPSTAAQMSRAQLDYDYRVKADNFLSQLNNSFSARSTLYRNLTGNYPPSDIGLWGDDIKRSGSPALRFFGISSTQNDNFAQPVFNDYEKTNNPNFLPSAVSGKITVDGVSITLPTEEARFFEKSVGEQRKKLIAPFVNNMAILQGYEKRYNELDNTEKLSALKAIYDMGYENGKSIFIEKYPKYKEKITSPNDGADKIIKRVKSDVFKTSLEYPQW
jgi:hypothetical protein